MAAVTIGRSWRRAGGAALLAAASAAHALNDPMRPGNTSLPARPAATAEAPADTPPETVLVATRRDPQGRWTALLGNVWLGVGERVDGARIVSITDNDVVLLRGSQRFALTLLPVHTTPSRP